MDDCMDSTVFHTQKTHFESIHTQMYKLIWVRNPSPIVPSSIVQSPIKQPPSTISSTDVKIDNKENVNAKSTKFELPLWQRILFFVGSILAILSVPANVIIPLLITGSQIPAPSPTEATYDVPTGTVIMYGGNISTLPGTFDQWLYCDGSAVNRTTYKNLFTIIGISFGPGDGSTTFNLPDFRNRFPYGAAGISTSTLTTGGSSTVSLTTNQLPSHTHGTGTLTTSTTGAHIHSLNDPGHGHSTTSNPTSPVVTQYSTPTTGYGLSYISGTYYIAASLSLTANPSTTGINMGSTGDHTHTISGSTAAVGSGSPITILPPYQTIHFIIRT